MKKNILLVLSLFLVVACAKKYDVINSQAEAEKLNKKNKTVLVKNQEVLVPEKVFFDFNKAIIKEEGKKSLNVVAEWLKSNKDLKITVEGHCDERGTREYNLALGQRRAEAVKKYLASKSINFSRIRTVSYGKERPEFLGSGERIWAKNRRAVIVQN
ncbi:MAG: peptidoglycan-associated lipoprotein Pal [Rickettsiales bacterium]|jgi:peptidoglycan-associated lipoprotein|nr:peptidoglycan-associated lipoprotein Pal [Rickettsiales bacterium]